ncbi:MAG: hypothetical protein NT013_25810 [Planctomycetia bacterium]|nr:hypothetical protein [Planctomycetia bacterium]
MTAKRRKPLFEWLQGVRNLRSDVLDRVAQAVGATVSMTVPTPTKSKP